MFNINKKTKIAASCAGLFLTGCILIGVVFGGTGAVAEQEPNSVQGLLVEIVMSETGDISVVNEYIGIIESSGRATVFPRASGEVLFVHFNEGDMVTAGDVLFEIDSATLRSALEQSQTALSLAQSRADQNLSMAVNNLNNFKFNIENGHDMTIRNALNAIDMAYAALNNALIANSNATLGASSAEIASGNAGLAVESAGIASNNVNNSVNSAAVASGNAELGVLAALGAQNNARIALKAAENRLNSAVMAHTIAKRQFDDFYYDGIYPISMIQLQALGLADQVEEQLKDARTHAVLNVEAAELGVEQARNAYDLATITVEQARNGAILSGISIEQAESAVGSASIGVRQAENASALSEIGIAQAMNGVAMSELSIEQAELNLQKAYDGYETALVMLAQQQGNVEMQVQMAALNTNFSDQHIAIQRMENDLKNFTVTAPISGIIERRNVEPFGMAAPQSPAFIISDDNGLTVSFRVPRSAYANINIGSAVTLNDGISDYTATVKEMSATVDPSGLFTIKASIKEPPETLFIGASVKVSVDAQRAEDTLLIPINAVYYDNGAPYVYIIEDDSAKKTYIETGIFDSQNIQVLYGISVGDRVINTWSARLADGVPVVIAGNGE